MSRKVHFTTVTPIPSGISREMVLDSLHDHVGMIDLNPLGSDWCEHIVIDRFPIKPPSDASAEEYHCLWYSLTDRVSYLPGGLVTGKVSYNACFHDLALGLQTHVFAPLGLSIKGKWTVGGSLPGEPKEAVELGLGVPREGLWLREDVEMKCNMLMIGFVKKTLVKAHETLVDRLVERAHVEERKARNYRLLYAERAGSVRSGGTPSLLSRPESSIMTGDRRSVLAESMVDGKRLSSSAGSAYGQYGQEPTWAQLDQKRPGASVHSSYDPQHPAYRNNERQHSDHGSQRQYSDNESQRQQYQAYPSVGYPQYAQGLGAHDDWSSNTSHTAISELPSHEHAHPVYEMSAPPPVPPKIPPQGPVELE
ncbi:hypothetical protein LTR16_004562 [Cryomyces antarcticus]|uniref:DUF7053 domain-containing protein n=1 Tax=Cryomyces antarcticus TaxID=329879 RepID=A0ABR0LX52_9PEZI|nr:hypothetical protein LTR16_004562 [Cryomyces antarcticus]